MSISPIHPSIPLHPLQGGDTASSAGPNSIAESVSPILSEEVTAEQLEAFEKTKKDEEIEANMENSSKNIRIATGAASVSTGVALGILTVLGLTGVMLFSNPIGWGIAGGLLLIVLVGSAIRGRKEFFEAVGLATLGYTISLAVGSLFGIGIPALAASFSLKDFYSALFGAVIAPLAIIGAAAIADERK